MSRLTFSNGAFARKLQVSNSKVFAFVEGGLDRPFADRLLRAESKGVWRYQVIGAKELPGETGGKPRLVRLYAWLRKKGMLRFNAYSKESVCMIFLDKDIDDLTRRGLRSDHVIYTESYDLEGDLFLNADLVAAVSDALGMTREQAGAFLGLPSTWIQAQVERWADWATLCVISQARQVKVGASFDRMSAINPDILGATDEAQLGEFKRKLKSELGCSGVRFSRMYDRYRKEILKCGSSEQPLRLFKGKWLAPILEKDASRRIGIPDISVQLAGQKVLTALVAQVGNSPTCTCCSRRRRQLTRLLGDV
ncbi:hypothetical protein [Ramlibacter pallidus]|uniref:DUF4435 domain-containing protein n=1 Tax=Ramlibacter pallidus TaxID=2780087 RepID=A0ABR9S0V3_9BURK|nr:hypothetical protein [Ramlibacter pallidus]MBE7367126.1 hypothetical protein [Ramlibacter pallidus]